MRLYLVRHGQTVANAERRFQGHKDFPLSEIGVQQVQRVAERFREIPVEHIYSSDLGRALATAEGIAAVQSKPVIVNPIFREYCWGIFDGLTLEEAKEQYPHIIKRNVEDWGAADIPEKETKEDFIQRIDQAFQYLIDRHMGKRVLLVSHGRFLNAFMTRILRVQEDMGWAFTFNNTSISVVDFINSRKPKVRVFNDTNHLYELSGHEDFLR